MSLSFRDRFFSPPVARALTSPSGILALGAGVAVGIVVTAPVGVPLAVIGAVVGGAVGLGTRLAFALPKQPGGGERMDPFAVNEPWRHAVIDAVRAKGRFTQALKSFQAGPLRDTMDTVGRRLDEAVEECWRIAKQGQLLADARRNIDDRDIQWELQQARAAAGPGTPSDTRSRTIAALEAQLATAARMDALIASTKDQLDLLNARLDESVTRAIELSVSNQAAGMGRLGDDVGAIVEDLEALRMAMEDVDRAGPVAADPGGFVADQLAAPPVALGDAPDAPPPLPAPGTEGRGQAAPGS